VPEGEKKAEKFLEETVDFGGLEEVLVQASEYH